MNSQQKKFSNNTREIFGNKAKKCSNICPLCFRTTWHIEIWNLIKHQTSCTTQKSVLFKAGKPNSFLLQILICPTSATIFIIEIAITCLFTHVMQYFAKLYFKRSLHVPLCEISNSFNITLIMKSIINILFIMQQLH